MLKHLQKLLLIAALCVPWVTQAQCPSDQTGCPIFVEGTDDYGDGWNDGYLQFFQGTTSRGSFGLDEGSSLTGTINICDGDSVRVVWNAGEYDDEVSFTIYNGDGTVVLSDNGDNYSDGETIITFMPTCPSCLTPTNLSLVPGVDQLEVSWVSNGDETSWIINYNGTEDVVTTNPYTIQNLTANTLYNVSVRALCGVGDTSMAASGSALTLAGEPISEFPFVCTFEDNETNGLITFENGSQTNQWYIGSATNNGGDSALYISNDNGATNSYNNSSTSNVWAYATFSFTAGQYIVSFDWKATGESCCDYIRAFLIPGSSSPSAGTLEAPSGSTQIGGNMNQQSSWQTVNQVINIATDGIYKLAFVWHNDGSVGTNPPAAIDNISVTQLTCPAPVALTLDSVTTSEIFVSWTPTGDESSWLVMINDSIVEDASDTVYYFQDLAINTAYSIRVAALCDDGDTSLLTDVLQTRTLAGDPISVFPYTCGFEYDAENEINQAADWVIENNSPNGWYVGQATNNGGAKSLYISNDNGVSNNYTTTTSCVSYAYVSFQLDPGEYAFSFDWKTYGEGSFDYLRVAYAPYGTALPSDYSSWSTSGAPSGFTAIDGGKLNLQSNWQNKIGTFTVANAGVYNICFVWRNDGSAGTMPGAAIDNFQLVHNTCPAPTALQATRVTQDSVYLTWTAGGSETEWIVSDGTNEYVTNDTHFEFDELYASTSYNFTVRGVCDDGDSSMFTSLSVRTACGLMTLPYTEDFENYTTLTGATGVMDPCWNYIMTNSSYSSASYIPQAYQTSTSYYRHSGDYSLRLYGVSYTTMPQLPCSADSVSLSFWAMRTSSSYNLIVGIMSDPTDETTFDTIQQLIFPSTLTQTYFEINLAGYTGTGRYIAFRNYYSNGTYGYSYVYLDDINVWVNSSCASPAYVQMSNVSNNMATVSWADTSSNWNAAKIYLATTNNISAAIDSVIITDNSTSYTFTGLTGSTNYYVWVQGDCSDELARAVQTSFTTAVDCAPVENLRVSGIDYHAFALEWDAPSAGYPATQYVVSWKHTAESTWISDTVTNTYYYINGLGLDSTYNYRVSCICDELYSAAVSGTVQTFGAGTTVGDGSSTSSYLPTYTTYNYSYTQQILLDEELVGIDSIASIAFYNGGSSIPRNIVLFMGNTTQSSFSSTSNYVPVADLDTVYTGQLAGTGWVTLQLTEPFVRTTGSNLVIACDDNTGSWTSGPSWRTSPTSAVRGMYYYQDGSDISPTAPSASSYSTVSYVNQVRLTPPTVVLPDCARPIVMIDTIGQNDVTIVFPTEDNYTYEVSYRMASETEWTVFDASNTNGIVNITGLSAATNYIVRVTTDCNGVTLMGSSNFWTLCGPVDVPFYVDFESMDFGNLSVNCWNTGSVNLGAQYPYPYVVSLTGDPNKLLLLYNGAYVILPQMNAPLNELQARFAFTQGGDSVRLLIGLVDDPMMPISTMTVLDTLVRSDISTDGSTVQLTYSFANINLADTNKRIAFWDAFNDNYSFIDNLNIEYIPACTPVTNLAVATTTSVSADISWNAGNNASSYIIEYGPRGFVPGSADGTMVTVTGTSATLSGLDHSTSYDAYVYSACTTLGDTSIAAGPVAFTTSCDALTELPYVANFENIVPAGTGSTNYSYLPNCWVATTDSANAIPAHIYYTTTTSYAPSQAYALRVVNDGYVVLNEMGVSLDTLMLSFHDYNMNTNSYGVVVGAVDDNNVGFESTFTPIDTLMFGNSNESVQSSYLVDYTGNADYIALRFFGNNSTGTAHYIDNLTIDYVPSCIAPQRVHTTNLTHVDCDIAWMFSQAASYNVEYGVHGFTPGTGTTMTTTTRAASLTNLTPNTQYDVYLVSGCGSDTTFFTFRTLVAAPATVPYYCDFAAADNNGWELIQDGQASFWMVGPVDNNRMLYITDDSSSYEYNGSVTTYSFAARAFNLTQAGEYAYSFDWKCQGESSFDFLRAALVPADAQITAGSYSGFDNSSAVPAGAIALDGAARLNLNSSFTTREGTFNLTQPGAYKIVFMWRNDGSVTNQPPAAIDNVSLALNTCPAPTDLTATLGTDLSSAVVDWTDVGTPLSYIVEYGPAGFEHGSDDAMSVTTTTHPVTITGLSSMTNYDIFVRPVCTGSDTGRWIRTNITTPMCSDPFTAQSFNDTAMTVGTSIYAPIGYSYYNYGYTQTIIDASRMADMAGDIQAFAFQTASTTAGDYFTNMDVYLANVTESDLSGGFIHPDENHAFVQVISGANFNYDSVGWFTHIFDVPFTWDGQSNVLLTVNRRHGSYSSGATFVSYSDTSTTAKTRHVYTDGGAYNPATVSGGTAYDYVGGIKFYSCGAGCAKPSLLPVTDITYQSATINWNSSATNFEVAVKAATDATYPEATSVSNATSYAVTGLAPATMYRFHVRAICDETEGLISDWVEGTFTTDSLPCFEPTELVVQATGYTTVTLGWTANGEETNWRIHVWNTAFDTTYDVNSNPATVGGLAPNVDYSAEVMALCGAVMLESGVSNTVTFHTAQCEVPTGVTVSNVTAHTAVVSWTGNAQSYRVTYGYEGFGTGNEIAAIPVTGTTTTLTGLESGETYDVYVYAVCETGIESNASTKQTFETDPEGITTADGMNVSIYPNPTTDATTIALSGVNGEVSITIVDMNGRIVKSDSMSCEGDCTKRMEVNGLAQGAYFVRINGEGLNMVKKLVVK